MTNPIHTQAGLDSLAAVELRNGIAAAFNVQPPVTLTYDYPTLAALADFLVAQLAPAVPAAALISSIQVRLNDTPRLLLESHSWSRVEWCIDAPHLLALFGVWS